MIRTGRGNWYWVLRGSEETVTEFYNALLGRQYGGHVVYLTNQNPPRLLNTQLSFRSVQKRTHNPLPPQQHLIQV